MNPTGYCHDVDEFNEAVAAFLKEKIAEDVRFIVAVDGKGEITLFRAPDVRGKRLTDEDWKVGVNARITQVSSSALVGYKNSDCQIYQSTKGGQASAWAFCKD